MKRTAVILMTIAVLAAPACAEPAVAKDHGAAKEAKAQQRILKGQERLEKQQEAEKKAIDRRQVEREKRNDRRDEELAKWKKEQESTGQLAPDKTKGD